MENCCGVFAFGLSGGGLLSPFHHNRARPRLLRPTIFWKISEKQHLGCPNPHATRVHRSKEIAKVMRVVRMPVAVLNGRRNTPLERSIPMAKFLFIYRDSAEAQPRPSPEEMQEFLALWGKWFEQFPLAIVDGGDALLPTGKVLRAGGVVTDGPYVEAKEMIGGYSVIEAADYDQALAVARGCPIAMVGGAIEIRQFAGLA